MAVNPMMESVMSAGVHGMNVALKGVRGAAQEIAELNISAAGDDAQATVSASDEHIDGMTDALTSLKLYERQVQAASKVVETADELVGFLLDVHA